MEDAVIFLEEEEEEERNVLYLALVSCFSSNGVNTAGQI
jgi:hypothetical protein